MIAKGGLSIAEVAKKIYRVMLLSLPVLCLASITNAQIRSFKANASEKQKTESVIYKNFVNECDLMIAYTRESFWWGDYKYYDLMALNKGIWYKGYLSSQLLKSGKWTYPKVRFKKIDPDSAKAIVDYVDSSGLLMLSRDSLRITDRIVGGKRYPHSLSDGVNYKFEILVKNELETIEAYAPDFFLEKIPEIKTRAEFIKFREWFELKYMALEPIDE